MKYLILGAGGMAGHLIAHYLIENNQEVEAIEMYNLNYCKTHILDVTNFDCLKKTLDENYYDFIVNCIGILNENAEKNVSKAILINSYLPHFLVDLMKNKKTIIVHISTDYVFSDKKAYYSESDISDGITYYSKTKYLGEINDKKNITFRTSIIGPDINKNGNGLFNWFMKQKGCVNGYTNSYWCGITTLMLAKIIYNACSSGQTGLFNLSTNKAISKYELLKLINSYIDKKIGINQISGVPRNSILIDNRKLFIIDDYEKQISELHDWVMKHKYLYSHYFE